MNILDAFATNVFLGLVMVVDNLLTIYKWVLIIAILLTWVRPDPYSPIMIFLRRATEPFLDWFRRKLPFLVMNGLDLSPIAAILSIEFLRIVLIRTLMQIASQA